MRLGFGEAGGIEQSADGPDSRPGRLAQVVDAGPEKRSHDPVVRQDIEPRIALDAGVAECRRAAIIGVAFGAENRPGGVFGAHRLVPLLAVIHAEEILEGEGVEQGFHSFIDIDVAKALDPGNGRAGRLQIVDKANQPAQPIDRIIRAGNAKLVADAPHRHTGTIAVARDGVGENLRPLVFELAIPRSAKLIGELVHHQETHPVIHVHQFRGARIMAGAHSVAAESLQNFQSALPNRLRHGGADAARVVMQADAFEFDRLAIEQEAAVLVVFQRPHAEMRGIIVHDLTAAQNRDARHIEIRLLQRPKSRSGKASGLLDIGLRARPDLGGRMDNRRFAALRIENRCAEFECLRLRSRIADSRPNRDIRLFRRDIRTDDADAPVLDAKAIGDDQPNMTVNARPRVPAAVRLEAVVHANAQDVVFAELHVGRQIVIIAHVAVVAHAERVAVDPDFGVAIDAIELNQHALAFVFDGQRKGFSIPGRPGGQKRVAARPRFIEIALDAVVMGQIEPPPLAIVELALMMLERILLAEAPVLVQKRFSPNVQFGAGNDPGLGFVRRHAVELLRNIVPPGRPKPPVKN
ncbi:MAG: hypothetical protein BWZ10_01965 [candidate division BRC1 bacterium ADurb.BinA364]|nr:MAG: hypothetical protein BWZ10_01965 [candidate division BRC1 bacterium ADurb.BinA364]